MVSNIKKEDKEQIKRLLESVKIEEDEPIDTPIILNKYKNGAQYKVNIPKKYVDIIGIDKDKHVMRFILKKERVNDKLQNRLIAELVEKND